MNSLKNSDNAFVLTSQNQNHVLILTSLSNDLKQKIDSKLLALYMGPLYEGEFDLPDVKLAMKNFYAGKPDEIGHMAEFIAHLFLLDVNNNSSIKLKQEFLFKNIESKQQKYGFDGVYSDEADEIWFFESKSSLDDKHGDSLAKAYDDLKNDKFIYNDKKRFETAYSHAFIANKNDTNITKKIDSLASGYLRMEIDLDIANFNIIPCATLFQNHTDNLKTHDEIHKEIDSFLKNKTYKNCITLAVTTTFIQDLIKYICGDHVS